MTTTLLRAGALSCALLATTCLTAPAAAQSLPSVYQHVDDNGVDLTDGSFNFALTEGSIGSGEAMLALVRQQGVGGATDNFKVGFRRTQSGGNATIVLTFGNRREEFTGTAAATSFASAQGNGATLNKLSESAYAYTDASGTTTYYEAPPGLSDAPNNAYCSTNNEALCTLVPISTTRPGGNALSYVWHVGENCISNGQCAQFWRLEQVNNSFGYRVEFSYTQESDPSSGLPGTAWHQRETAVFSNTTAGGATRTVNYDYPSSTVTEITTDGNETWRLTGTGAGLSAIRRPGSTSDDVTISYVGFTVVSQVVADGVTTNYSRSVSGTTGTITRTQTLGAQTLTTTIVSDLTKGRPTSITDPTGRQTSYQYDANARPTRITQDEGNYTHLTYDSRGNVTESRTVAKAGSGLADIVTSATFPASCTLKVLCHRPETTTDARNNVTEYDYDPTHGGVTSVLLPAVNGVRPETRYSYTQVHGEYQLTATSACRTGAAPACLASEDEVRTLVVYDANGNVTSTEQRDGRTSGALIAANAMTYDAHGNLLTVDGPLSGSADTVRFRYDQARRRIGTVSPDPDGAGALKHQAVKTIFNNLGLPIAVETGTVNSQSDGDWAAINVLERVEQTYDGNRRPTEQRLIAGGTTYALTQTGYDSIGRVSCVAQRMNPAEFAAAQPDACTLDTAGSFGPDRIARTSYDAAGRAILGETAVGTADEADEVAATYTDNGQIETATDAEGNRTTYEYDGHDRLRNTRFPSPTVDGVSAPTSGAGADFEQFGYDAAGNVTSFRRRSGATIAFTHDALNRMTLKDVPEAGGDVAFGYDLLGRQLSAVYSATGLGIASGYDSLGRQVSTTANLEGASRTYGFQYDLAGRRTRITHPDGVYFDYAYDGLDRMTTLKDNGGATLVTLAYDSAGRRDTASYANGVVTSYDFDPVGRLTSLAHNFAGTTQDVTFGYAYNPASQIQSRTISNDLYSYVQANSGTAYSTDGRNQYTAVGGAAATHDANGNLTSEGGRTLGYDSQNRLVSATSTAPGTTPITLAYDPQGRLRSLVLLSLTAVYDMVGTDMVALRFGTAAPIERHVFGPGVDEPMVTYNHSLGTRSFSHADGHGSIVALSDAGGAAPVRIGYDDYGRANGVGSRFLHAGKLYIATPAAYYNNARFYDPGLGRFLQTDPIGYGDGMNLYAYAGNDPVNGSDPSGLGNFPTRIEYKHDDKGGYISVGLSWGSVTGGAESLQGIPGLNNGGGVSLQGGYFLRVGPNAPATGKGDQAIVTASHVWVPAWWSGAFATHYSPGGPITEAQAACRSCHGVDTLSTMRYATREEEARLTELTVHLIPWALPARSVMVAYRVSGWLRPGYRSITTPAGNRVFESADGLRRFRIDFKQGRGTFHGPHAQFETRSSTFRAYEPATGAPDHVYFGGR